MGKRWVSVFVVIYTGSNIQAIQAVAERTAKGQNRNGLFIQIKNSIRLQRYT